MVVLNAEQKCLLWLSSAEITPARVDEMLSVYRSAQEIWDAFGHEHGPRFQAGAQQKLLKNHSREAIDDLCEQLNRKNVHLLFRDDAAYPQQLLAIDDPPYLLYYAGHIDCLSKPMIGVVGSRKASTYGAEMATIISRGLCEAGVCVVSGLARGIDAAAHQGALSVNGRTIGVLGSGINVPYPPEHTPMLRSIAGGIGLILSEYPLNAEPVAFHFPHRNRIISGLSQGVVFVEGRIKSGGMHTVSAALMQGREVFAVPGRVGTEGSEGPHTILREGARIVTCAADILEDIGLKETATSEQSLQAHVDAVSPLQQRLLDALRIEPLNVEELAKRVQAEPERLIMELGMLEILGRVKREAGNRFALPVSTGK